MNDRPMDVADAPASPAVRATAVMPHDDRPLPWVPKALYVGSGGDIAMRGAADAADTLWRNVPDGALLPFRPSHVRAAGTTASDIVAMG